MANAMWQVKFTVAEPHTGKASCLRNVMSGGPGAFHLIMMSPDLATPAKAARRVRDTLKDRLRKLGVPGRAVVITSVRCVG
jgi:hypothetical protein